MLQLYNFFLYLFGIRLIPHLLFFYFSKNRQTIVYETKRWQSITNERGGEPVAFFKLMLKYPEFRNLFYNRVGFMSNFFSFLCPGLQTLSINTRNIAPGLFIQHGYGTIISARAIGKDCWINQDVTIGFKNSHERSPLIGDNVTITAGAKIIGDVTVGNNSTIGANSVVVKNVPENCTVVGVPARIIRRNGIRVDEPL